MSWLVPTVSKDNEAPVSEWRQGHRADGPAGNPPMQVTKRENMPVLVPELVDMASTPVVSTADLLRRALVVARRLAVPELVEWINSELTGYRSGEVPEYRRVHGQLVVEDPRSGAIPFLAPPEMAELLADFSVRQSIPD